MRLKLCVLFVIHYIGIKASTENVSTTTETLEVTTIKRQYFLRNKGLNALNATNTENSTVRTRMATICMTPNNDSGYCLEIQKCPHLLNQLGNPKAVAFLRNSECGPRNQNKKTPKVCCGKYDNYKHLVNEDDNIFPKICGRQNVTTRSRIVGGSEAELGEFPWMARLIHKNKYGYRNFGCSGFLIHAKYVLTAAHCLNSDNIDRLIGPVFEIQFGEHDIETETDCNSKGTKCADKPIKRRVLSNITHPKYIRNSRQHHFDIALIHLKSSVKLTQYVYPICLLQDRNFVAVEYWLSGWGATEDATVSRIKQKLSIPHFSWKECALKYNGIDIRITKKQICAGGLKGKDSCTGDSGGPLMVVTPNGTWYAAGIVSYGLGCGKEHWPGVYTNVTSYIDWIKKTILEESTKNN